MTKFSPKLAFLTIAGLFGALLMGWLVVVARGLYLARHLFTLYIKMEKDAFTFHLWNITRVYVATQDQFPMVSIIPNTL